MFPFTQSCSDIIGGMWDFSIAPPLLFYAYIPIMLLLLLLGTAALIKDRKTLANRLLFILSITFAVLLINEIVQWVAAPVSLVMFGWELVPLFRALVILLVTYFVYVFMYKKDVPGLLKSVFLFYLLSVLVFLPSTLNIEYFDLDYCEGVPSLLWDYVSLSSVFAIAGILTMIARTYRRTQSLEERNQNVFIGIGAALFLMVFFATSVWGDITQLYDVALAAPVGALLFVALLSYTIVKFKTFNIKLAAPIMLVFGLWAFVFSLLFVHDIQLVQIIVTGTLILLVIFGIALIRSVRREVKQREEIEGLAEKLKRANKRLRELDRQKSEFVSIASHQLRSPLTAIRGYASMLKEGSFGAIPKKAEEAVERIHESSRFMALSIEDFLNVSRIEQGRMKYELSDFNLKEMAEKVVDEMRSTAIQKGLVLMFRSECTSGAIVHADIGKVRQVIYNLVDNAMKYTPKGSIMVVAHDDVKKKKMYVTISDTGVGMSKETLSAIFEKFVRAKNANSVNVSGTGLGLFVAKQMIEAMGGSVTPQSEGEGKGSKFIIELPLAQ